MGPLRKTTRPSKGSAQVAAPASRARQPRVRSRQADYQALQQSEKRLALAQQAGHLGIFDWDVSSNEVFWTPEMERLFGLAPGRFEGTFEAWARRVHPEDSARLKVLQEEWLKSRQNEAHWECRIVRADGQIRWVAARAQVMRDAAGKAVRMIGTNVDITERKQVEEALRESEERYRALVELAPDAVVVYQEWRFVYANAAALQLYGADCFEQLRGKDIFLTMLSEDHETVRLRVQRVLAGERVPLRATQVVRLDGERVPVEAAGRRIEWCGRPAVQIVLRDITERKRMEQKVRRVSEELAQANHQLEQAVQERTAELREAVQELHRFSYALMHDMRAPLRAMHSFASVILQSCAGREHALVFDYLGRIQTAAERMDALIRDSLDYAKAVQHQMRLAPVHLGHLLRGLIESYPNLQSSKARIELEEPLPVVMGNEGGLTQCFANLLGNAVKFVPGGTRAQVRVRAEPRESLWRVWVEDNGIGIAPEDQERIFEMFHRLDQKNYDGTGIGLAIVRKAVERMGGRVGVESQPGKGSRFWVELKGGVEALKRSPSPRPQHQGD